MKRALVWALLALGFGVVCLAVLGWQRDLDPTVLQAKYANNESQFIDAGKGLMVHVRDEGSKDRPALVLLHGSNASLQAWEPWVQRLGGKYRIVTLDLPGHGLTGPHPDRDYRSVAFVGVVDRVADKLGLTRFAIGGNTLGGWVAWHYALSHPDRVSALILIDASGAPGITPKEVPLGTYLSRNGIGRYILLYVTPRSLLEDNLRGMVGVKSVANDELVERYWELLLYPGNRRATVDRAALQNREQATPALMQRLNIPTLVLWGEKDTILPVEAGRWFAEHIPRSKLIVYPGLGQLPMEEGPDQTAKDLDAFMSGLATPSQK